MSAMSWSQDPAMRQALVVGITAIRGHCDQWDPDCLIGALVEAGYCVIRTPEPLGPPRGRRPEPSHHQGGDPQ